LIMAETKGFLTLSEGLILAPLTCCLILDVDKKKKKLLRIKQFIISISITYLNYKIKINYIKLQINLNFLKSQTNPKKKSDFNSL
jgi:uncharacterized membrane protein YbhN (UPF0104 family)